MYLFHVAPKRIPLEVREQFVWFDRELCIYVNVLSQHLGDVR